jgi:hypothetical protein
VLAYPCQRVPQGSSIGVDGVLDEAVWQRASAVELVDVVDGSVPLRSTEVKALWDSAYLYVAFVVEDSAVRNTMTQHDAPLYQQDVVELFLDPDGDGLYYYELEWNCLNATFDLIMASAPGEPLPPGETTRNHLDWTASGSHSAVVVNGTANNDADTDSGMVVEVALAWSDLQRSTQALPPASGDSLRANFYRIDYPTSGPTEYTAWSPTGAVQYHMPSKFGALVFVDSAASSTRRTEQGHGSAPAVPAGTRAWAMLSGPCGAGVLLLGGRTRPEGACGLSGRARSRPPLAGPR